ncbi:DUF2798 domain-containing protein [Pseudomonas fluorescens]|jgi:hypothetical protein|uniref:DUF2798 domain-containing protein n=1 Tax=Pseudomonas TaxID=286 RepID=UPI001A92A161|nr:MULTISPECIES: DUF2798 domain-containing protein [Pseudomonas]MDZ5435185.1 DUF2798 domain-containing protein [Pseudomonas fluorescens]
MRRLSPRYRQHATGVIQSAITCAIAAAIASPSGLSPDALLVYWFKAWLLAWATLIPFVLLATPLIKRLATLLVEDEPSRG